MEGLDVDLSDERLHGPAGLGRREVCGTPTGLVLEPTRTPVRGIESGRVFYGGSEYV